MSQDEKKTGATQTEGVPKANIINISEEVLARVSKFQELGQIILPKDYSAANALKAAFMILQETEDKDGKKVLDTCSRESVASALFKMVVMGLSVIKRQCSFIAYAGKLTVQREYAGTVLLAKRFANIKEVNAQAVYQGDEIEYGIDLVTGRKKLLKHNQKIENIDLNKIVAAYAIVVLEDGSTNFEIMNMVQIRKAWEMGYAKGDSKAHKNFTDEMVKKTVVNRICKPYINSSSDANIIDDDDDIQPEFSSYEDVTNTKKELPTITMPEQPEVAKSNTDATKEEKPTSTDASKDASPTTTINADKATKTSSNINPLPTSNPLF